MPAPGPRREGASVHGISFASNMHTFPNNMKISPFTLSEPLEPKASWQTVWEMFTVYSKPILNPKSLLSPPICGTSRSCHLQNLADQSWTTLREGMAFVPLFEWIYCCGDHQACLEGSIYIVDQPSSFIQLSTKGSEESFCVDYYTSL